MTNEHAIWLLQHRADECGGEIHEAYVMAIKALENIGHLKDRPCSVCEFHKENGCCKWTCVFTDRLFGDMR